MQGRVVRVAHRSLRCPIRFFRGRPQFEARRLGMSALLACLAISGTGDPSQHGDHKDGANQHRPHDRAKSMVGRLDNGGERRRCER
jgi:hypothetical protein